MCNINRMATKKEFEEKREYARLLFMQGETQKVIAEKVGVSAVTINKWVPSTTFGRLIGQAASI